MNIIEEMEVYALENKVPIMQQEGIDFLCTFIKEHHIKRILEIGSAIGYSAIRMALVDHDIEVVTIERDEERYQKALVYASLSSVQKQIIFRYEDALEAEVKGDFDMLFIDAAKAQYTKFFERYEKNIKHGGYIISDNLNFHGFVGHEELIVRRNLRQLVKKIERFTNYLKERKDYDTTFLEIGDGIGISQKL